MMTSIIPHFERKSTKQNTWQRIDNTRRVERILKLIIFLNNQKHSVNEIAVYLELNPRSVYRYLNLLVQLGFHIEQIMGKYFFYRITNVDEVMKKGIKTKASKS